MNLARRIDRRHDHWWRSVRSKLIEGRDQITLPLFRSRGKRVPKRK